MKSLQEGDQGYQAVIEALEALELSKTGCEVSDVEFQEEFKRVKLNSSNLQAGFISMRLMAWQVYLEQEGTMSQQAKLVLRWLQEGVRLD